MKFREDLLRCLKHEIGEDLHTILIDLVRALNEVVLRDIGELACEALAIQILFLIAWGMRDIAIGNDNWLEAVVFAVRDVLASFLSAPEEAQVVLLIDKFAKIFVKSSELWSVEGFLVCHYLYIYYLN